VKPNNLTTYTDLIDYADFARDMLKQTTELYTVRRNGIHVAGALVCNDELTGLFVVPECRGLGLGSSLLRLAQCGHLYLTVTCVPELVSFYRRAGFCPGSHPPANGLVKLTWHQSYAVR
jgi:GNAT superfamily N-acetyltransferase